VTLFQNKNQRNYYRLKPRYNPEMNGHWMCDSGRLMYEHLNANHRILNPKIAGKTSTYALALRNYDELIRQSDGLEIVLTPQLTNEEYENIVSFVSERSSGKPVSWFVWRPAVENISEFDGILKRGDLNANTQGLKNVLGAKNIVAQEIRGEIKIPSVSNVLRIVFGPEVEQSYTGEANMEMSETKFPELLEALCSGVKSVYFGNNKFLKHGTVALQFPIFTYAEKNGTFVNHAGIAQKLKANPPVIPTLKPISEILSAFVGAN
jgi:NADH-quinone oxidoreductase subunit G